MSTRHSMNVGQKIKQLRLENNMTQEQFGAKLFVTRNAVSKWESNRGIPSIENLKLICDLFHISMNEIMGINYVEAANDHPVSEKEAYFNLNIYIKIIITISILMLIIYGIQFNIYHYSMTLFVTIQFCLYLLLSSFLLVLNLNQFKQKKHFLKLYMPIIISLSLQALLGLLLEL